MVRRVPASQHIANGDHRYHWSYLRETNANAQAPLLRRTPINPSKPASSNSSVPASGN